MTTEGSLAPSPLAILSFIINLPAGGKLILLNSIQLLVPFKNGTVGGGGSNFLLLPPLPHDLGGGGEQSSLGFQKKFLGFQILLQGDYQLTVSVRLPSDKLNASMRKDQKILLGNSNSPNPEAIITPTSRLPRTSARTQLLRQADQQRISYPATSLVVL